MKKFAIILLALFAGKVWAAQVQIHRFYNGNDYFLTLDRNEGLAAGYKYEGVPFLVESEYKTDRTVLMRCYDPAIDDHFTSLDPNCEGKNNEGPLGYVYREANNSTAKLWRCSNPITGDHLTTVNGHECLTANYKIEVDQCHAIATIGPVQTIAQVYRFFNGRDYWYTTDFQEGQRRIGYVYQSRAFSVYSEPPRGIVTFGLFQCRLNNMNNHFISNYQNCEGHTLERLIGFAPDAQLGAMVPLLRCSDTRVAGLYLTTIDQFECTQRMMRIDGRLYGLVRR